MVATIDVSTSKRTEFVNITRLIGDTVRKLAGKSDGCVVIFVPHTTAGITVNENADPDVTSDIIMQLDRMVPWKNGYAHSEGNSAAHLKAGMMGFSVTVPYSSGELLLGTWQGIYLCEFDGPRQRRVLLQL